MATQLERLPAASEPALGPMACDRIVPEDVSFLIVCECASRSFPASTLLTNLAIVTGATGLLVGLHLFLH